jgi:hypothetical protein
MPGRRAATWTTLLWPTQQTMGSSARLAAIRAHTAARNVTIRALGDVFSTYLNLLRARALEGGALGHVGLSWERLAIERD